MHIKPKKSLGQNFLFDKNIQNKIINACALKPEDSILEIGAGSGQMTKLISEKCSIVYALEIDHYLCRILKDNLGGYKNIRIINRDILSFSLKSYFRRLKNKIKIVGNIPFYITTPIIEHLLRYRDKIDTIFITVQKEFAKRMIAKPGSKDYGSFSCFLQYYTEPQVLFLIKKTSFWPMPKVDSSFLSLKIRDEPLVKTENERLFFKIIRAAFNKRRKTLRNSLKGTVPLEKLKLFFHQYNIDVNARPEELTLGDFANLNNL